MGLCISKPELKVKAQKAPEFALVPLLVKKEKCIYGLMEKRGLKNLFLGKDDFKICNVNTKECAARINQPTFDMGSDRMELQDAQGQKIYCVSRRARMSLRDTFYIYTIEKPYPEAELSNESHGGTSLYCWGFISRASGLSCNEPLTIAAYYWDAEKPVAQGKDHPYKPLYTIKSYGCSRDCIVFLVNETDEIVKDDQGQDVAVCQSRKEAGFFDMANMYSVEIAAGVDTCLMLLCMAIRDEMTEKLAEDQSSS